VPNIGHTRHDMKTLPYYIVPVRKRNHKWVKLKSF